MLDTKTAEAKSLGHDLRRTIALALPVMLARMGLVLLLTVDTVLVGRAGGRDLAFFAISTAPQLIMQTIGVGLLLGTVVLTAQADGAKRYEECGRIWRLALILAGSLGLIYSLIESHGEGLLRLLGQDPAIAAGGGRVLGIWAIGMPAILLYLATTSFLEGISKPRPAMIISLSANLLNAALGWALISGHGGLPALGAAGAALATAITLWIMFLVLAGYALLLPEAKRFGIRAPLKGYYHLIGKLLLLGLPVALSVSFETSAFSGATIMAGWMGETALAAYQLSVNVTSFFYMLSLGLATAAAVRVGNAVGRSDRPGVARAGWVAVAMVFGLMLAIGLAIHFLRGEIAAIYTRDAAVTAVALPVLAVLSFLVIFDGVQGVLMGALRGAADVILPTASFAIAFWGCAVPLCYFLGYRLGVGPLGLAWGLVAGLIVADILLGLRFAIVSRRPIRIF
ncbi:MAG TPA: MATE family efflux transporter [Dongiaceae bacterium]|nr:MATE family efflux transporter [Dongiaceae bacterium]